MLRIRDYRVCLMRGWKTEVFSGFRFPQLFSFFLNTMLGSTAHSYCFFMVI